MFLQKFIILTIIYDKKKEREREISQSIRDYYQC